MGQYIIRLDDASEYMDLHKWTEMECLLDEYDIKPIFGIIPQNKDDSLVLKYDKIPDFWALMHKWIDKGWIPAMHGYEHKYVTNEGGINPVNYRSEFAGLTIEEQIIKIRNGYMILTEHGIFPEIFFAPSHTFDFNTLCALERETPIRIISDTIARDTYKDGAFWFLPQQSGVVRRLPLKTVTFCYHPNTMDDKQFEDLKKFIKKYNNNFATLTTDFSYRKIDALDLLIRHIYFFVRKI